jgi:hypothetical protein
MELRRAPRVICDLWAMIAGVHEAPIRLTGDISLTGIFFELDRDVGAAGSLQWMKLETLDHRFGVEVMARIIRSLRDDDVEEPGPRFGLAFEFMPDTAARFTALQELVSAIVREVPVEPEPLESSDLPRAAVFHPRVSRLTLEANWPVRIGEIVQVVFRSPGTETRIPFEGQVIAVERASGPKDPPAYAVDVELSPPGVRILSKTPSSHSSISESVDIIFNALVEDAESHKKERSERKEHLVGLLSRISVTSLLSLFELERVTGQMRLVGTDQKLTLYVREGEIIDAVTSDGIEGREALRGVLQWQDGSFDFTPMEIDREDRIGMPMTMLLLELARELDESESDVDIIGEAD